MKMYKIGFTSGVYDLFHVGHLNILERAKSQCEHLIVAVSTDECVMAYKHKMPVVPFEERMRIVKNLRCVDEAVPQENMDKMLLWEKYHFDVMFHGDDWKNSRLFNKYAEDFAEIGVEIIYLPHTPGISTTEILDKIRNCSNNV